MKTAISGPYLAKLLLEKTIKLLEQCEAIDVQILNTLVLKMMLY
jgi:hypothetical protein